MSEETQSFPESDMGYMFMSIEDRDYYRILNVSPDATKVEIREAYLRIKNSLMHNHAVFYSIDEENARTDLLSEIEEAYSVLENEVTRKRYDARSAEGNLVGGVAGGIEDLIMEDSPSSIIPSIIPEAPRAKGHSLKKQIEIEMNDKIRAYIEQILSEDELDFKGAFLRELREMAGLTILDVHETIRVPVFILEALEEENFQVLPSRVYVRGFLSNYLKYLAIKDADKFISPYMARFDAWTN